MPFLRIHHFFFGVFVTSLLSFFFDDVVFAVLSVTLFIYFIIVVSLHFRVKKKKKTVLKSTQNKEHKAIKKLKTARAKEAEKKHAIITNQVAYIAEIWELSQQQEKTFLAFIEKRAYSDLYTKMTAALLPQLTKMIEECIERDKVGCKREVSARLNELVLVMKAEIKRNQKAKKENFDTLRDVYDHLLSEVK